MSQSILTERLAPFVITDSERYRCEEVIRDDGPDAVSDRSGLRLD